MADLAGAMDPRPDEGQETLRVITVRMPKSLHERLKEAAHTRRLSMNQSAIAAVEAWIAKPSESPSQNS